MRLRGRDRTEKKVKVRGTLGTGGKRFPPRRNVPQIGAALHRCKVCGEKVLVDTLQDAKARLVLLDLNDGKLHRHKDG